MFASRHFAILFAVAFAGVIPAQAADKILAQTTFDTDLGGWTASVPSEVSWSAGGGDPGGRAVFTEDLSGSNVYLIAPKAFLAPGGVDYRKLDGKAYFSWEHEIIDAESITTIYPYEIRMSGPAGSATFDGGVPVLNFNKWRTAVAPIVEGDWTVTSGTWLGLLADVESVQINIEQIGNGADYVDVEAIDNIKLVSHPKGFSPK